MKFLEKTFFKKFPGKKKKKKKWRENKHSCLINNKIL